MPQGEQGELAGALAARRNALRRATSAGGADPVVLLEAALTELDAAIDALGGAPGDDTASTRADASREDLRAERRLAHAAFQLAPAPLFLLAQDGTVRRANAAAARLLGVPAGYATGRPLTAFLDAASRAAVRTSLAAVTRTGESRRTDCLVQAPGGLAVAVLAAAPLALPGEPPLIVATVTPRPTAGQAADAVGGQDEAGRHAGGQPGGGQPGGDPASAALRGFTRRLDLVTRVSRVLLDNAAFSEAVTIRRCARLLAGGDALADWVIVDTDRDGTLRRQAVAGPPGEGTGDLTAVARDADPAPWSAPGRVHETGEAIVAAHADDPLLLGEGAGGDPLLPALGVTSVLCVPVRDPGTAPAGGAGASYGTLTLARLPQRGPFGLADLALAEELGTHLALAIGVSRRFRERSKAAETLQASLLPARLPAAEGLEFAAAYLAATGWQEIGADFYDVFAVTGGWAVAVGDVSGRGQEAAAMTAAARHAIRALVTTARQRGDPDRHATVLPSPAAVLGAVNDVLLAGEYDNRYVTARLAFLRRDGDLVRVTLGGAGHPGPAVLRADGRTEIFPAADRPLGLFAHVNPEERSLALAPGDLLLFYTDGAAGADLAAFEERLADQLAVHAGRPAAEVVRGVQSLIGEFSGGDLRDDVTLLAVRAG